MSGIRQPWPWERCNPPTAAPSPGLDVRAAEMLERVQGPTDAPYSIPVTSPLAAPGEMRRGVQGVERRLLAEGVRPDDARRLAIEAGTRCARQNPGKFR